MGFKSSKSPNQGFQIQAQQALKFRIKTLEIAYASFLVLPELAEIAADVCAYPSNKLKSPAIIGLILLTILLILALVLIVCLMHKVDITS